MDQATIDKLYCQAARSLAHAQRAFARERRPEDAHTVAALKTEIAGILRAEEELHRQTKAATQ